MQIATHPKISKQVRIQPKVLEMQIPQKNEKLQMNILGKLEAKLKFQNFAKIRASENSKKRGKLTKLKFGDFQNFCHSDKLNISSKIKFSQQAIFVNSAKIRGRSKSGKFETSKNLKKRQIGILAKLDKLRKK